VKRLLLIFILALILVGTILLNRTLATVHYLTPVQPGELAYLATFDGLQQDWQLAQGRLRTEIVDQDRLRITVNENEAFPYAVAQPHFADFDLTVAATAVEGSPENAYGIVFRLRTQNNITTADDNFYVFMVSSDGFYRVWRRVDTVEKVLSGWIPSDAILQGLGVTNQLRVIAKGNSFRFFVNDQPLQLCIPDDPQAESTFTRSGCVEGTMQDVLTDSTIPNGQIALGAQTLGIPGWIVDFDNLLLYGPE
jgi:hypothetical protein